MPEDYRKTLHQEIAGLQADIVRLAALTGELLVRATDVLLAGNLVEAQRLIDADDDVDLLSIDIEERCFATLALQSPMASDLRAVVATMKINSDIERGADLMVNVAKASRRLYGDVIPPRLRGLIQQMSDEAGRLLRLATDAFVERNGALGAALHDIDDRLDTLQREFVQAIFEAHANHELGLQAAVQLAVVGRFYERLGDHAVNIGEWVAFLAHGRRPEHQGAARARNRAAIGAAEVVTAPANNPSPVSEAGGHPGNGTG